MRPPRESSLGFGTIKVSFWRCTKLLPEVSPLFDRTKTILGKISPTYASFLEVSLEMRLPLEFSLGFGAIKTSFWRCTKLPPEVSPVFKRTEPIVEEVFPTYASLPEISLEMLPPREFSLGFGAVKASFWRYSGSLPEVSPVFDRTEATLGEISPIYASLAEVSLEMRPPREFSLGFGTIKASFWSCSKLLPEVSPVSLSKAIVETISTPCDIPHKFSRGLVIIDLSIRPIVDCCFCNSFDAHTGWVRGRRGARSLNILFCRSPIFDADKRLDV